MIINDVAALLDGDADKARSVLRLLARRLQAGSDRIQKGTAPSLHKFGLHRESRARELAALYVREWSALMLKELDLSEMMEQSKARMERVEKLLAEMEQDDD